MSARTGTWLDAAHTRKSGEAPVGVPALLAKNGLSAPSFELVQELSHTGVWEYDFQSGTLSWSTEVFRIFGQDPARFTPTLDGWLRLIHDEDRPRVSEELRRSVEGARAFELDCRVSLSTRRERTVSLRAGIVLDGSQQPCKTVGIVQDVTSLRYDEQKSRLAQRMEAMGRLASGVAHDFNNIQTIILGYVDLLLQSEDLPPHLITQLKRVATTAERGCGLTQQLMAFSRRQALQPRRVDVNEVISQAGQMLERILGEDIMVRMVFAPNLPPVMADPGNLEQSLIGLAVNAREAMPKGGLLVVHTGQIEFITENLPKNPDARLGRFVWFSFSDSGSSISPDALPHLFEPYFCSQQLGRGSGMQLPSTYGLIRQHQGWIDVSPRAPQGNCFTVYLPAEAHLAEPTPVVPAAAGRPAAANETVLLVEDDNALRPLAATLLESMGYKVMEAQSGPEALKVWCEHAKEIDILFTDMVMPGGISGRELACLLREESPHLRVLYTSGHRPDFLDADLVKDGSAFLPKPYTAAKLAEALKQCVSPSSVVTHA